MYTKLDVSTDQGATIISPHVSVSETNLDGFVTFISGVDSSFFVGLGNGSVAEISDSNAGDIEVSNQMSLSGLPICSSPCSAVNGVFVGTDRSELLRIGKHTELFSNIGKGWVEQVTTSPEGTWVAYASGKKVYVKDAASGDTKFEILQPQGTVMGLAFSASGNLLAIARYGGISLWDMRKGKEVNEYKWQGAHLNISLCPNNKYLVTTTPDKELHCWDLSSGKDFRMSGYPSKIRSLSWTADGQHLAAAGADSVTVWPFVNGDPSGKPPYEFGYSFQGIVTQVAAHPKQDIIAAGYNNGTILLGKYLTGEAIIARAPKGIGVSAMTWNKEGTALLAGTEAGDICKIVVNNLDF